MNWVEKRKDCKAAHALAELAAEAKWNVQTRSTHPQRSHSRHIGLRGRGSPGLSSRRGEDSERTDRESPGHPEPRYPCLSPARAPQVDRNVIERDRGTLPPRTEEDRLAHCLDSPEVRLHSVDLTKLPRVHGQGAVGFRRAACRHHGAYEKPETLGLSPPEHKGSFPRAAKHGLGEGVRTRGADDTGHAPAG